MTDPIQTRAAAPLWATLQRRAAPSEDVAEASSGPVDTVTLSPVAQQALSPVEESEATVADEDATQSIPEDAQSEEEVAAGELTPEEEDLVSRLKARDREVRAHEAAHISASGGMAGGATYTYQVGPDGNRYAIGGKVQITTPGTSDPRQALANAQRLQAAAMAPGSPSGQDRAVAAEAVAMANEARAAIAKEDSAPAPGEATRPSRGKGISSAAAIERFEANR